MTFVQIGEFDWLSGRQTGSIFVKMFKNLLLRNHKVDVAETVFLIGISRTTLISIRKAVRCVPTCNEQYCCMKGPHGYRAFADR